MWFNFWDYKCDIASYADNNTPYTSDISLNLILEKLESSTHHLFRWFKENHMKANPDKYNLLVTTNALTFVNINSFQITNSTEEKLLGIKLDSKLSFQNHASSLCKKASQKLHALTRIANYVNLSYYPLVRMFHSRKRNPRINSIHEGAIRVKYQDYQSMLLQLYKKITHQFISVICKLLLLKFLRQKVIYHLKLWKKFGN